MSSISTTYDSLVLEKPIYQLPLDAHLLHEDLEDKIYQLILNTPFFQPIFEGIDKTRYWKLVFMERDELVHGKYYYEELEPGYLQGIYKGYYLMLQTIFTPLEAILYKQLHDTCSKSVCSKEESEGIPLGFRKISDGAEAFGLIPGYTVSEKGVEELKIRRKSYVIIEEETKDVIFPLKIAIEDPDKTIIQSIIKGTPPYLCQKPTREETCKFNVNFLIDLYEKAPKETPEQKLHAIARLCQDLDQFHFFVDGNIRTTGILVMNKLLIENGLSPTVMKDVNQLDCLSEEEIVSLILEGQEFFQSLKHEESA